jgi:hypothetical protein
MTVPGRDPGWASREAMRAHQQDADALHRAQRNAEDARRLSHRGGGPSGCGCLATLIGLVIVAAAVILITHNIGVLTGIAHHLGSSPTPSP